MGPTSYIEACCGSLLPAGAAAERRADSRGRHVVARVESLPDPARLGAEWRALEAHSDGSFFTSWSWVGAWLASLPSRAGLTLVRIVQADATVGLGIVGRQRRPWRGKLSLRALHLHSTGDYDLDRITPEHNDLLCDRTLAPVVRRVFVQALGRIDRDWDELHLPGMMPAPTWTGELPSGLQPRVRTEPSFAVDLASVRGKAGAASIDGSLDRYLALLSSNTRSQIRRSMKEYARLGPLDFSAATSVDEALEFLSGLRELHQAYWISRGEPGAFAHPFFQQFHRRLIEEAFGRGEIELMRLRAGPLVVGYLYNFRWRGATLNYQSGFDYGICEKHGRPGLVVQALAIAASADRGLDVYDFMAGSNRSKESLATRRYGMDWIVVRRPRLKFWLEARLRGLLQRPLRKADIGETPPK